MALKLDMSSFTLADDLKGNKCWAVVKCVTCCCWWLWGPKSTGHTGPETELISTLEFGNHILKLPQIQG